MSSRAISPTFDPPRAPSTSRLMDTPALDFGPESNSSPKRNKASSASWTSWLEPHEASILAPSNSDSQESCESVERSRDSSGPDQCKGEPSARTIRRRNLASLSTMTDRAFGRSSGDSHATKNRPSRAAVEQAPRLGKLGSSSPMHKTRSTGVSSSTQWTSPVLSILQVKGPSKKRMILNGASSRPSASTSLSLLPRNGADPITRGTPSSASTCIPNSSTTPMTTTLRRRSRTPSPTEDARASWPKREPSPQIVPKSLKPTSSILRARYPTPPVSIASARGSSVDLRTFHEPYGGKGPAAAADIDVIIIDDTDEELDDERDGRPASPKRARYSHNLFDEEETDSTRRSSASHLGGSSRWNTSKTTDPRSPIRSSTIPTPEQFVVDPELFIASANWSRRIIIDVLSLNIDCLALNREVPEGQAIDLELELALVADVDGGRTELDLVGECVRLERCASNATGLIFAGSKPHTFELDFDPTALRTATDIHVEITLRSLDGEEWDTKACLPISDCDVRGVEHIIPYGSEQTLRFSKTTTARMAYRSAAMLDSRMSELDFSARELDRRLDRVRLENVPVWLPDALDVASMRYQEIQETIPGRNELLQPVDHGPTRYTYDFVTKRPVDLGQRIMEPSTTETPLSTIQVRQQLNAVSLSSCFSARVPESPSADPQYFKSRMQLLLRTSYTAKERLVRRLHLSWTILNPFPPSIVARELACWNHFAPVIEHFMAGQQLEWFLWTSLVMKGENGQYRGLLSVPEWEQVRKMYRKQVRKIEKGRRQSYEVWRGRAEESVG
ncbi:BZ3500_MvSof-1268-A1-R1_Chr8-1g10034 [Microbotryum saponariae]|uniref:BZ3500_MvSof-1268-A1-R1_Chr8-1g10034 protein n=1 Tax=Microbotryum saponariae TaxID=289078 RepID=A0A2X0LRT7_9BASI|nr:BZ3500_MvSof-1268-A1-R1_Chr8-1g10034 [Microbotryum saponariae]SDA08320.1 BZ3501_MvSof-1269-A2-R1_Chr8-1g09757 [Microbotryum saponariae]